MQGTRVGPLGQDGFTVSGSCNVCTTTAGASAPRAHAPRREATTVRVQCTTVHALQRRVAPVSATRESLPAATKIQHGQILIN